MTSPEVKRVSTSHGAIVVEDTGGSGTPLLMIHGNSSCRQVFAHQMQSVLARDHRLISVDLPGHGQSDDAHEPARTYPLPGLADSVAELLTSLEVKEVIVLGWSLGGHIAIQLLSRFQGVAGLILTGAPPIRRGAFADGFLTSPAAGLAGRAELSDAQANKFAGMMFGAPAPAFLPQAIRRADGRFREELFAASLAGGGVDQRRAVEASSIPIAVINGEDDPIVRLDYFDSVAFDNLWNGRCYRLPGAGHAAFWRAPDRFNALVALFIGDLQHVRTDRQNRTQQAEHRAAD